MAYVGYLAQECNNDEQVINVRSATTTLQDGMIVVADELIDNSTEVYNATQPTAVTAGNLAIVMGAGDYQTADGDKIGKKDPTTIDYPAGTDVRAYRGVKYMRFKIDKNAVTTGTQSAFIEGNFLNPTANSNQWTAATTATANATLVLKIERLENFSIGLDTVEGAICRVERSN